MSILHFRDIFLADWKKGQCDMHFKQLVHVLGLIIILESINEIDLEGHIISHVLHWLQY